MKTKKETAQYTRAALRDSLTHLRDVSKMVSSCSAQLPDTLRAETYLRIIPAWEERIRRYAKELKVRGEKVVYVDVCGRAEAMSLDVDQNFSFSLCCHSSASHFTTATHVHQQGDLFQNRDFLLFLRRIKIHGTQPALVTFCPRDGLSHYTTFSDVAAEQTRNHVTYALLARNLKRIVDLVRPGGFILLERPFQIGTYSGAGETTRGIPPAEWRLSRWLADFCKHNDCAIDIGTGINVYYLIRKRRP